MSYCDLQLVDSLGTPFQTSLMAVRENRPPTVQDMLDRCGRSCPAASSIRRGALEAVGGFPEPLRAFEDVYLWLLLREEGPFAYVPEKLAVWRFAHFPAPLKPPGGQEAAGRIFRQMVMARYGVDPIRHVRVARARAAQHPWLYRARRACAWRPRHRAPRLHTRDPPRSISRAKLPAAGENGTSGHSGARAQRQIGPGSMSGEHAASRTAAAGFHRGRTAAHRDHLAA